MSNKNRNLGGEIEISVRDTDLTVSVDEQLEALRQQVKELEGAISPAALKSALDREWRRGYIDGCKIIQKSIESVARNMEEQADE